MVASDLTIDEVAARLGLPVEMIRRRVEAGDLPVRWVEIDGRLEVRVPEATTAPATAAGGTTAEPPAVAEVPSPPTPAAAERPAGTARGDLAPEEEAAPEREWQELVRPGQHSLALTAVDARQLVAGLFDRWERALERRIEAEQRLRFAGEIDRRTRQIQELRQELEAVRSAQAAQLAEREREVLELRARLREADAATQAARSRWWRR